jgi:hypothetical protein
VRLDPDATPIDGALRARIEIDGHALDATCDAQGLETWRAPRGLALRTPPLQALATELDLARAPGPVWLDVAALIGGRAAGVQMESPLGRLLTLGAVECGDLIVQLHAEGDDIVVRGRSRGGLVLPALLLHLAARSTPPPTPAQAWQALAYAARDSRREEAALQLAFSTDVSALPTLRSLLFARDAVQGRAAEALARRSDPTALVPLARALQTTTPTQRAALETAIATLWPRAPAALRSRARMDAPATLTVALGQATPRLTAIGLLAARALTAILLMIAAAWLLSALRAAPAHRTS